MELTVAELGQIEYRVAWEKQQNLVRARRAGEITDTLLLLEHPHTFTIGRKGTVKHLIANPERLKQLEVEVVETDRGGDITYHGPGQLVGYPLLDLRLRANDVHRYLRNLEDTIIQTLLNYGLNAVRVSGYTGVWLETEDGKDKIAAIGVKVSQGVTMHGFALNVNTDLDYFKEIIPCGITEPGLGVTSLQKTLGRSISVQEVSSRLINAFAQVFGYNEVKSLQAV